jgi:sugar transferase EpsL
MGLKEPMDLDKSLLKMTHTAKAFNSRLVCGPIVKRFMDVTFAAAGLLLLSPLIIVISAAIKIVLGSPIFFRQERPGYLGRPFRILKFRTMSEIVDAKKASLADHDRLTAFGSFLRSTSLDELPELFNVLIGEMSIVGPRPLLMEYLDLYSPEQFRRHDVKPGITGWAQVNGRNTLTWDQKFALDLWYVDHHCFGLDLKIVCLTFWQTLRKKGINQPGQATVQKFMGNGNE